VKVLSSRNALTWYWDIFWRRDQLNTSGNGVKKEKKKERKNWDGHLCKPMYLPVLQVSHVKGLVSEIHRVLFVLLTRFWPVE
jgi:hypothetical protein